MTNAIKAATQLAIGKESTRGTAVAASRRIITKDASVTYEDVSETHEDQMAGTLARTAVAPTNTRNGSAIQVTNDLDFENILFALLSGVKGGVTPTGATEYTWTFQPGVSADPAPDTYTVEYAESDFGVPARDMREMPYCFTTEFNIQGGVDALPQLLQTLVGRKPVETTLTALTVPAVNFAANLRWALYMDDSWANLGTTQILGQVYSFDYGYSGAIKPQFYLDNRADLDFSKYEYGKRTVDLSVETSIDPTSGQFVPNEETKKAARALRFCRLEILGAAAGGGTHTITLDGAYYHADDSLQSRGGDREGNAVTSLHLLSALDATSSKDCEIAVLNTLASFP